MFGLERKLNCAAIVLGIAGGATTALAAGSTLTCVIQLAPNSCQACYGCKYVGTTLECGTPAAAAQCQEGQAANCSVESKDGDTIYKAECQENWSPPE